MGHSVKRCNIKYDLDGKRVKKNVINKMDDNDEFYYDTELQYDC